MKTILTTISGLSGIILFWIFECLVLGFSLLIALNIFIYPYINMYLAKAEILTIPPITYFQCVAILLFIRVLKYDSISLGNKLINNNKKNQNSEN